DARAGRMPRHRLGQPQRHCLILALASGFRPLPAIGGAERRAQEQDGGPPTSHLGRGAIVKTVNSFDAYTGVNRSGKRLANSPRKPSFGPPSTTCVTPCASNSFQSFSSGSSTGQTPVLPVIKYSARGLANTITASAGVPVRTKSRRLVVSSLPYSSAT